MATLPSSDPFRLTASGQLDREAILAAASQARVPKGSSNGGQFAKKGGGAGGGTSTTKVKVPTAKDKADKAFSKFEKNYPGYKPEPTSNKPAGSFKAAKSATKANDINGRKVVDGKASMSSSNVGEGNVVRQQYSKADGYPRDATVWKFGTEKPTQHTDDKKRIITTPAASRKKVIEDARAHAQQLAKENPGMNVRLHAPKAKPSQYNLVNEVSVTMSRADTQHRPAGFQEITSIDLPEEK